MTFLGIKSGGNSRDTRRSAPAQNCQDWPRKKIDDEPRRFAGQWSCTSYSLYLERYENECNCLSHPGFPSSAGVYCSTWNCNVHTRTSSGNGMNSRAEKYGDDILKFLCASSCLQFLCMSHKLQDARSQSVPQAAFVRRDTRSSRKPGTLAALTAAPLHTEFPRPLRLGVDQ